jgi:hypothetical protein
MASSYDVPPALPRAPTDLRGIYDDAPSSPMHSTATPPQPPQLLQQLQKPHPPPPPPRFPSLTDVGLNAVAPEAGTPRRQDARAPVRDTRFAVKPGKEGGGTGGLLKKLRDLLKSKPKTTDELEAEARARAEAKPALVKAKEAICKLPDPTLLFMLLIAGILLVFNTRPELLKTWTARILVPVSLAPTVAATALWRRTRVISLKPDDKFLSAAAPFPNAGQLVTKGEKIRQREAALAKAENDLRIGQMKLEVMRKEVESRLPPDVTVHLDHRTGTVQRQLSQRVGSLQSLPAK